MTKDDIISLPNPHLRKKSRRVGLITDEIRQVIQDMQEATIDWDKSRAHEVGVALPPSRSTGCTASSSYALITTTKKTTISPSSSTLRSPNWRARLKRTLRAA